MSGPLVVTVDGSLLAVEHAEATDLSDMLQVRGASEVEQPESVLVVRDALDDLHAAFAADQIHVEVAAKAALRKPVVVVHMVTAGESGKPLPACFPHLYVHLNTSAEASVVEVLIGVSGVYEDAADSPTNVDSVTERRKGLIVPLSQSRSTMTQDFRSRHFSCSPPGGNS